MAEENYEAPDTESEEYEAKALAAMEEGNHAEAQVFASLALTVAVREASEDLYEVLEAAVPAYLRPGADDDDDDVFGDEEEPEDV